MVVAARSTNLGILMVLTAAVSWSTAGYFTRLIPVDAWTMVFWRGVFGGACIAAIAMVFAKENLASAVRAMGFRGWFVSACSTVGMTAFVFAFSLTSVANVAVVFSAVPLIAALVDWLVNGCRPRFITLAACVAVVLGAGLMLRGMETQASFLGELFALIAASATATVTVVVRRHTSLPLIPLACLPGFFSAILVLPFATPFSINGPDYLYLLLFGLVQVALGVTLFTAGSKLVSPVLVGLILVLKTPFEALWVWIAFGEEPTRGTMIGGGVIMAAVVAYLLCEATPKTRVNLDRRS